MIKHKLIFLCLALLAATTLFASDTQVDGIWYDFDNTNLTASVTYRGSYSYKYYEYSGSVVIPASVSYNQQTYSVTTIGDEAFRWCNSLTSVTIPNSVTTIGEWAFEYCSGLKKTNYTGTIASWCKIKFSGNTSNPIWYSENFFINDVEVKDLVIPEGVDEIGERAFVYCRGLTSVTIPNSVTTIGDRAFYGCTGLTSITIPNSVTTIGNYAFYNCIGLTSITIPNSVTTIGDGAFCGCEGLTGTLIIPNSVTTIGNSAFRGCSSLTSVTIPNSVKTIGDYAFRSCSGLTSVTIPNSVTTIGKEAFYHCRGLTSVTCYATTPPTCGSDCFYNVDKTIPVYVPTRSEDAYKQAEEWKAFTNILPIGAEIVPSTDEIITQPSTNSVIITWPSNDNAVEYKLVITKDGIVFCTLTFNSLGQLVGMAFAPARSRNQQSSAESTTYGYSFVVSNLDASSTYDYVFTAKDITDQVLSSKSGCFTTKSGTDLLTLPYEGKDGIGSKFFQNGQLYILRDGKTYTMQGTEIK